MEDMLVGLYMVKANAGKPELEDPPPSLITRFYTIYYTLLLRRKTEA